MLNNFAGYTKDQLTHLVAVALRTERPDLSGREVLAEAMAAMEALTVGYYQKGLREGAALEPVNSVDDLLGDDE